MCVCVCVVLCRLRGAQQSDDDWIVPGETNGVESNLFTDREGSDWITPSSNVDGYEKAMVEGEASLLGFKADPVVDGSGASFTRTGSVVDGQPPSKTGLNSKLFSR